jgi:recombination protein RecR
MNQSYFDQEKDVAWIPSFDKTAKQLSRLPGIGPRMAQRLTFSLLKKDKKEIQDLIDALRELKDEVKRCSTCGNFAQSDPCPICTGESRDRSLLCVVEQPQDMLAIERTKKYKGLYHVLGGALSPIDGIGPEEIGIPKLISRIDSSIKEVILATNPTMEGDATAIYLQDLFKGQEIQVTRLARGLPSGSDLEYADESTLALALSSRTQL